jgi:hypothetical protein
LPHFVSDTAVTDCSVLKINARRALAVFEHDAEAACFLGNHQTIEACGFRGLPISVPN